ncbi:MAG TPA: iron ABC transporter permease, partial [Actinobacteria bacterium]|nr:iron ABC transporter permease [Actinomycetota bacterium]
MVAVVVCVPLVYLIVRALEGGAETARVVFEQPSVWQAAATSLALAALVAVTTVCIGVPVAWLVVRAAIRARQLWIVVVVLPLAVPSFVGAFAWASLFPGFAGFWAAWVVLSAATLPYVILPTAAALRSVDPAHEEVARTLGLRAVPAFLRAALPQIWPAVGGGALLVALYVLSDFGAVSILRVDTLSRAIYASYRSSFDRSSAAILALLLALLAVLVVAIEQRARGRAQRSRLATAAPRQPLPVRLGRWTVPAYLLLGSVVTAGLVVPLLSTIRQLATGSSARLDVADLTNAALTSAWYGLVGMVFALGLAIPVGLLAGRYPSRLSRSLERFSFVGHALPGVVVGLSIVFVGTRLVPGIYQTVALLGFAYGVLFLPKAAAAVRGSVATVPPVLEDVARTLGHSPFQAFMRVTLRLASPGIAAGALLVLLTVMKELPATLMLRPTGENTLATRLWSLSEVGAYAAAAPYSLSLIAIGAIPAFVLAVPLVRASKRRGAESSGQQSRD